MIWLSVGYELAVGYDLAIGTSEVEVKTGGERLSVSKGLTVTDCADKVS